MKFHQQVKTTTEHLLSKLINESNPLVGAIHPIIKMGKKALYAQLENNPKDVYYWLLEARVQIDKAIEAYHDSFPTQSENLHNGQDPERENIPCKEDYSEVRE